MKGNKFAYLLGMVGLAILTMIILWIIAIIGSMDLTDGCLYRYNLSDQGNLSNSDVVSNTVILKATANYTGSDSGVSSTGGTGVALDPSAYGKWLNTNLRLKPDQFVQFYIKGEVSLCKAYIPINNLQQDSNLDVDGNEFTDAMQVWIDKLMDNINSRQDKNNSKISKWQNKIASGVSERKRNRLNNKIEARKSNNNALDVVKSEINEQEIH